MVLTAVSSKTTFHYNNELVTPKYSLSTLQKWIFKTFPKPQILQFEFGQMKKLNQGQVL